MKQEILNKAFVKTAKKYGITQEYYTIKGYENGTVCMNFLPWFSHRNGVFKYVVSNFENGKNRNESIYDIGYLAYLDLICRLALDEGMAFDMVDVFNECIRTLSAKESYASKRNNF